MWMAFVWMLCFVCCFASKKIFFFFVPDQIHYDTTEYNNNSSSDSKNKIREHIVQTNDWARPNTQIHTSTKFMCIVLMRGSLIILRTAWESRRQAETTHVTWWHCCVRWRCCFCCHTQWHITTPNKPNFHWKCTQQREKMTKKTQSVQTHIFFFFLNWNSKCVPYFVISLFFMMLQPPFLMFNAPERARNGKGKEFVSSINPLMAADDDANGCGRWPFSSHRKLLSIIH